jgi:hypothetical protein
MDGPRLIVDTNQAREIEWYKAPQEYHPVLVMTPLTWAEILNGPRDAALRRVRAISQYDVLFGMNLSGIYKHLLELTETEIQTFEPIHPVGSDWHLFYRISLFEPTDVHWQRAKELKQESVNHANNVQAFLAKSTKENQAKKSKGETVERARFGGIEDALQELFYKPDAPYRTGVMQIVTEDGKLPMRAKSADSFFDAVLKNRMLFRALRLHVTISLGYADVWQDTHLNAGVSPNRNDVPDIHLPLYANDGDTILTADRKLRRALRHADGKNAVGISTWREVLGIKV